MVPQANNQPYLDSALSVVDNMLAYAGTSGFADEQIVIGGFSQGACLAAEFVKRHPRQYGGVVLMSGGLIGTDDEVGGGESTTQLVNVPLYIGCDAADFHIPWPRVEATAQYFVDQSAAVSLKQYTNFGHQIHADAVRFLQELLE